MLKIGDFSKLSRISIRMLRHCDAVGLPALKTTDDFTGCRHYAEDQLPVAGKIAVLKDMGFGPASIGEILKIYSDPQALCEFMMVKMAEVQVQADERARRLRLLETTMNYSVTLKTLPERTASSVRQIIPACDQEGLL